MRTATYWLSFILVFMIPWEEMVLFEGTGTLVRTAGLVLAGLWAVTVIMRGRIRRPHSFHIVFVLFVLWNAVSILWTLSINGTMIRVTTYAQLFLLAFILWDLYTSPGALRAGLQAYVLGTYVTIGSTIANFAAGRYDAYLRYSATGANPNDVGLVVALGIPVAWYLIVSREEGIGSGVLAVVNYVFIPAAVVTIVLTASRGALIAAVPGFIYMLATMSRLRRRLRVLILGAVVAVLFTLQGLVPQASLERLGATGSAIAEGDLGGRVDIWREGMAAFSRHPFLGAGSGAFRATTQLGKVAHNVLLSVMVEVGLVGLLLFAAVLAVALLQALAQPTSRSRLWLAVLAVWMVGGLVHTWEYRKATWLFLTFVVASAGLRMSHSEVARRAPSDLGPVEALDPADGRGSRPDSRVVPPAKTLRLGSEEPGEAS
jgi:O-antigen ligase